MCGDASWSPDGRQIACSGVNGSYLFDLPERWAELLMWLSHWGCAPDDPFGRNSQSRDNWLGDIS